MLSPSPLKFRFIQKDPSAEEKKASNIIEVKKYKKTEFDIASEQSINLGRKNGQASNLNLDDENIWPFSVQDEENDNDPCRSCDCFIQDELEYTNFANCPGDFKDIIAYGHLPTADDVFEEFDNLIDNGLSAELEIQAEELVFAPDDIQLEDNQDHFIADLSFEDIVEGINFIADNQEFVDNSAIVRIASVHEKIVNRSKGACNNANAKQDWIKTRPRAQKKYHPDVRVNHQ